MFRAAAIVFILSILLTTVASPTSTGANHEQGQPEHIFEDKFKTLVLLPSWGRLKQKTIKRQ